MAKVSAKQKKSKRKPPPHAWKPGQSGNPAGRPPVGTSVAQLAREVLEAVPKGKDRTRGQIILDKFADMAEAGSAPHANFLFDRGYGKPQESMQLSGGLSLYEQGVSEAAKLSDETGRAALLAEVRKLSGAKK